MQCLETLTATVQLAGGVSLTLRPIRAADEQALTELVHRCTPEDVRGRFFETLTELPHETAARLCDIDYDQEMALVAFDESGMAAVGRLVIEPAGDTAEYALLLRSDLKREDLAKWMLEHLLAYARERGMRVIHGDELRSSHVLIDAAKREGAEVGQSDVADDAESLTFHLSVPAAA